MKLRTNRGVISGATQYSIGLVGGGHEEICVSGAFNLIQPKCRGVNCK